MIAGSSHLLCIAGRKDRGGHHLDDALAAVSLGWVLPWFVCGWVPETLVLVPFGLSLHPAIEVARWSVLPGLYQTALVAVGLRRTYGVSLSCAVFIGLVGNGIVFVMFFAFLR